MDRERTPVSTRPAATLLALALSVGLLALPADSPAAEPVQAQTIVPAPAPEAPTTSTSTGETPAPAPAPTVQQVRPQGASAGRPSKSPGRSSTGTRRTAPGEAPQPALAGGRKARLPSTLTPALPFALGSSLAGLPSFFIESFQVPPFLLPIFQAAGTAYGIPWQVLAAINEVETDYGRDLSVSSAGAEGWMQFLPAEWAQYGVDANGDGYKDPYNPADAIFAAARYLRAAGGASDIKAGVYSYNHSQAYVESVLLRAQLLGGTPTELLGAITGLTEARFPVHAAAHFSDGFPSVPEGANGVRQLVGTTIYAAAGAPVIAVQDGEVVQIGRAPALGHFLVLRDAYGNTYTYGNLGNVASLYPVVQPHVDSTVSSRVAPTSSEPPPSGPATAGAQPRSPLSEAATVSGLALGAAATLEAAPPAASATPPAAPPRPPAPAREFRAGPDDVYLHALRPGVQVIAGTVLGHVAASASGRADQPPHILFQIRPAGQGAPLIDPKPILDGWVALENSSIFRAKGENPFLATSPSVGQALLESKQQLEPQVLRDRAIKLGRCGRQDVQGGRLDKRLLAMLEYLSVSGLRPTVAGLRCEAAAAASPASNAPAAASSLALDITAVNGIPVAGHQGAGSLADEVVRKLLNLQGASRPRRIVSLLSYPGARIAHASPNARDAIGVSFAAPSLGAIAGVQASPVSPGDWIKLIARLGEIPDPTVSRAPSPAALPDSQATLQGEAGGNN